MQNDKIYVDMSPFWISGQRSR